MWRWPLQLSGGGTSDEIDARATRGAAAMRRVVTGATAGRNAGIGGGARAEQMLGADDAAVVDRLSPAQARALRATWQKWPTSVGKVRATLSIGG